MQLRKYRWSRDYESAEEELIRLFVARNIEATRWTAEGYEEFAKHAHQLDKKLWCAEGSIIFTINDKTFSLQPGDALDIPANTDHSAVVGFSGCVCYESPVSNPVVTTS